MQKSLGNLDQLVNKVTVVDWDVINGHRAQCGFALEPADRAMMA